MKGNPRKKKGSGTHSGKMGGGGAGVVHLRAKNQLGGRGGIHSNRTKKHCFAVKIRRRGDDQPGGVATQWGGRVELGEGNSAGEMKQESCDR